MMRGKGEVWHWRIFNFFFWEECGEGEGREWRKIIENSNWDLLESVGFNLDTLQLVGLGLRARKPVEVLWARKSFLVGWELNLVG